MIGKIIKRLIDIIVAFIGIVVLSPVFIVLYFMVKSKLGTPVLFKQERPGLHGKIFTMYKFRSMTDETDEHGELLPDEIRLTKFGKLLRKTSLDELPELFNILKGDMSIVGPRPLLVRYLDRYTPEQARRHEVKPGLTGLAQINGRNAISWEEKFALDVWYVDNWSLWLDIKIFFMTFAKVFKSEGISSD
ncbi:MAG: sugar transferase, partial [Acetivibrio ethanolgignens]